MRQNAMKRWEEQQRLKMMSKKIAGAKSVLKSEKLTGCGGKVGKGPGSAGVAGAGAGGMSDHASFYMEESDAQSIASNKKNARKKRPEWKDLNHIDYSTSNRKMRAPPSSGHTPERARSALIQGLAQIEDAVKRASGSPNTQLRNIANNFEQLEEIKTKLLSYGDCSRGKSKSSKIHEGIKDEIENIAVNNIRASIDALNNLLDSHLGVLQEFSKEEKQQALDDDADADAAAAAAADDDDDDDDDDDVPDEVVEQEDAKTAEVTQDRNYVMDDSADICRHCDDVDDAVDITEKFLDEDPKRQDDDDDDDEEEEEEKVEHQEDYEDEFEEEEEKAAEDREKVEEEEEKLPQDLITDIETTQSKIQLFDDLVSRASATQGPRQSPPPLPPQQPEKKVSAITSKPFSFKLGGAGGAGGFLAGGRARGDEESKPLLSLLSSGPTLLNSDASTRLNVLLRGSEKTTGGDVGRGGGGADGPGSGGGGGGGGGGSSQPHRQGQPAARQQEDDGEAASGPAEEPARRRGEETPGAVEEPSSARGGGEGGRRRGVEGGGGEEGRRGSEQEAQEEAQRMPARRPRGAMGMLDQAEESSKMRGGRSLLLNLREPPPAQPLPEGLSQEPDRQKQAQPSAEVDQPETSARGQSAGGKRRINAAEIRKAMLAARGMEQTQGGAEDAEQERVQTAGGSGGGRRDEEPREGEEEGGARVQRGPRRMAGSVRNSTLESSIEVIEAL